MADLYRIKPNDSALVAEGYTGKPEGRHQLWVVTFALPTGVHTVHVLAESAERAIGQAECALEWESYKIEPDIYKTAQKFARVVPLYIQGWGSQKF